jgi:lipid-A-disaccharide synthase-like uncharacterized protein
VFETLGIAGIAIAMLAYVPQVVHLGREHCSAGVSRRAWMMWLVSSVLVGSLAIHRGDLVFILLQISSMTSAAVILLLAYRYRGMVCDYHAHLGLHKRSGAVSTQQRVNAATPRAHPTLPRPPS